MKETKKRLNPVEKALQLAVEFNQINNRKATIHQQFKTMYGNELEQLSEREEVIKAELKAFTIANEKKAFDKNRKCQLGPVVIKIGDVSTFVFSPKFDALVFANSFPNLVKIQPSLSEVKKALIDGDNRKSVLRLGVDIKIEDNIKIELAK